MVRQIILIFILKISFPADVITTDLLKKERSAKIRQIFLNCLVIYFFLGAGKRISDRADGSETSYVIHKKINQSFHYRLVSDSFFLKNVANNQSFQDFLVQIFFLLQRIRVDIRAGHPTELKIAVKSLIQI